MMRNIAASLAMVIAACLFFGACGTETSTPETSLELPSNIMQKSDPKEDDTVNILMVGNSFCYYYVEELYGLLQAAGIKARVCNVYYSGCTLQQHWTWWKQDQGNYTFFTTDENGRRAEENCSLEYCLRQRNWDVISLQASSRTTRAYTALDALAKTQAYISELSGYFREQFPLSKLYWQQTWSYQVGYNKDGYVMDTAEKQRQDKQSMREYSIMVCEKFDMQRVPSGEAWQIIRDGGYDNLCARLAYNNGLGDNYHDGDIGGGQYLNACVWFEVLTGQSCVGNTYRPDYTLEEDLIVKLQAAAHQAVEEMKAEN